MRDTAFAAVDHVAPGENGFAKVDGIGTDGHLRPRFHDADAAQVQTDRRPRSGRRPEELAFGCAESRVPDRLDRDARQFHAIRAAVRDKGKLGWAQPCAESQRPNPWRDERAVRCEQVDWIGAIGGRHPNGGPLVRGSRPDEYQTTAVR